MVTFLIRRLALAVVTLVLLSIIVFALGQVLPGDVGRNVLGGFASHLAYHAPCSVLFVHPDPRAGDAPSGVPEG